MIETNSLIAIAVAIAVIYFIIKFIVSPLIKLIAGIITIAIAVFVLQKYFNVDFGQIFGPFSQYVNMDKLMQYFGWIINPVSSFLKQLLVVISDFF